jgi:hypothetical protein
MKKVHLLCKRINGIDLNGLTFNKIDNTYTSGSWDFSLNDAKKLVGGKIYLHEAKSEASVFGGLVCSCQEFILADKDKASKKKRIDFIFLGEEDAKGVKWGGRGYSMEWTSGIIDG